MCFLQRTWTLLCKQQRRTFAHKKCVLMIRRYKNICLCCFNWSNFCGPCEYSCISIANGVFRVFWVHGIKIILYKSYTWLHQTLTTKLPLELINSSSNKRGHHLLLKYDNNITDFQNINLYNIEFFFKVTLSKIFLWYKADFGSTEKECLRCVNLQ